MTYDKNIIGRQDRSDVAPELAAHANTAKTNPNSWPECELRALEMTLESGNLDLLDVMLGDRRTQRVLALGVLDNEARIEAVRQGLADARVREAATGGPGSLINPNHPLTIGLKKSAELRARLAEQRRAAVSYS